MRTLSFLLLCVTCTTMQAQSPEEQVRQGDSSMLVGAVAKAVGYYDAALRQRPHADTYVARAYARLAQGKVSRAVADVDAATRLDSAHAGAEHIRGLVAFRGGDMRGAMRHAGRGALMANDSITLKRVLVLRGMVNTELGRYPEALNDLVYGIDTAKHDVEELIAYARVLDAVGDHAGSLRIAEILCRLEPKNIGHWVNKGYELGVLGKHEDALEAYDAARKIDRDEPMLLSNRAWSLVALGRDDEALVDVERSLRTQPLNAHALRTRALVRLKKGDRNGACIDLHAAEAIEAVPLVRQLLQEHCTGL